MNQQQIISKLQKLEKTVYEMGVWKKAPNRNCFTAKEVAVMAGCTVETIKKYEKDGVLLAHYKNAVRRYLEEDVTRFLEGYFPSRKDKIQRNERITI